MNQLIECGNRPLNSDPESFQPVFAELGKWLRAYFVGAAVGFAPGIGRREQSRCGGPLRRHTPPILEAMRDQLLRAIAEALTERGIKRPSRPCRHEAGRCRRQP